MKFEWDEHKNKINIRKHGIDFREAAYVFSDPFALNLPDIENSNDEERWLLLGKNLNEKCCWWFTRFVLAMQYGLFRLEKRQRLRRKLT